MSSLDALDARILLLFAQDPKRFEKFSLRFADVLLDFSKNRITDETLRLLLGLCEAAEPRWAGTNGQIAK